MSQTRPGEFEVVIQRDRMAPMRDGTRLATDVYLPAVDGAAVEGPVPALLTRTPYNKLGFAEGAEFFAKRGYARVVQDVRGRFRSEGDFYLLANEAEDGYDAIHWIAGQPWCNGQVGTLGTSYMSWTQSAAATQNPPNLSAMWCHQGAFNGLTSSLRQGGALELRWLAWAFWNAPVSPEAARDPALAEALTRAAEDLRGWLDRLPWHPGTTPLALTKDYERWAIDILAQATENDPLWQLPSMNFERFVDQTADVPTVYSGGWYDSYTRATTESFLAFSEAKSSPQYLIMGPWTHGEVPLDRSWSGDADFGPTAPAAEGLGGRLHELQLEFFDHFLMGADSGWSARPTFSMFVTGGGSGRKLPSGRLDQGGEWRGGPQYPPAGASTLTLYMHGGGGLSEAAPGAGEDESTTYESDPGNPVPSVSANVSSLREYARVDDDLRAAIQPPTLRTRELIMPGGADQRERPDVMHAKPPYLPLAARNDVVAFYGEPLDRDLEAIGPVTVRLHVSTDAPDTDFTAALLDCHPPNADYPDGYELRLSDSIKRLRFRNGQAKEELVEPGDVVEVRIELYPIANRFRAGHRIGIQIASSNYPRFDVNPQTGEPIGRHSRTQKARNAIWHAPAHPSLLELTASA